MISGSGRCSQCGGVEFHVVPTNEKTGNPSGPARWECERCGRIRNNYGEILVPGHYTEEVA